MKMGLGQGKRIVIIGGSAAGAAAGARVKRLYPNAEVYLFEKGKYVSYGACELPYFLSGEISSVSQLQLYTPEQLSAEKNITVLSETKVLEIDRNKQELVIENKDGMSSFPYDKVIISTGSTPKNILKSFGRFENVFQLKNIDDALNIKKYISEFNPGKLIILGAGYIALELVEAFQNFGFSIELLNIEELPLPGYCDNARLAIKELLQKSNHNYVQIDAINDFSSKDNELKGLLCGGTWIEADFFIEALGVAPNSALAYESGVLMQNDQTIKVDRYMKTSSANIFAAGDVTHGFSQLTGKPYYYPLAQIANLQARVAAANLFSAKEKIAGSVGTNGLSFLGWEWVKTGLTYEAAKTYFANVEFVEFSTHNKPLIMPDAMPVYWHVVYQKNTGKILGATIWGKENNSGKINTMALAIRHGISIKELSSGDFLYSPRFAPMIDGFQILGRLVK